MMRDERGPNLLEPRVSFQSGKGAARVYSTVNERETEGLCFALNR